ncbi:DNA helicase/exodeoxyribonuclease V, beta subunit [Ectothiorhodospira mobilis]|uniref:RecBCD enzyme subunit RecB n=1 Tax=Ectothiorhodospira mobilis TaxID=195064 RepID=A0A1I4PPR0_ECTMO|nr:exodeoxyribonuclease V subunit beta [Ectothiorhodospira mobilis]SFM29694.1 DNA helicase/exodeoxyribonuclease V, beta subunit [Ectothiorhodospira mobilis]
MNRPSILDPMNFPLHGSRLIEASAGTGKTFTIAALYVRLVLGHGNGDTGPAAPLLPPQILVVTFTDAATRELRERIHTRLMEAARHFRGEAGQAPDPFLEDLLAAHPDPAQRARCARRLDLAAQWMDEAAVSTIHGWCYRVLREHAFDSGSLFTQELETDTTEAMLEAVRDYWRTLVHPLDPGRLGLVLPVLGQDPQALYLRLRPLLQGDAPVPDPGGLEAVLAPVEARLEALKAPWRDDFEAVVDSFRAVRSSLNGNTYRSADPNLECMRQWACTPGMLHPEPVSKGSRSPLELFSRAFMETALKKNAALPEDLHQAFALLDGHGDLDAGLTGGLLSHAVAWIRRRFDRAQRSRARLGYDDLLTRVRDALDGPAGERLAATLRGRFPVALIDEFQDTDPVQYRIFERVYQVEAGTPEGGLFLIGDPKQSIYGFRGADIHTYLQARRATAGRHYTLGTNYRSTHAMVAAVNRLFQHGEEHHPRGAFLFAREGEGDHPVPFIPMQARGRTDPFQLDGETVPALQFWCLDPGKPMARGDYIARMADHCAGFMAGLLQAGREGRAGFAAPPGQEGRSLLPRDMAVLVRDRQEARAIQSALGARGVRSVYLSDRESVYATPEAEDVLRWMRAAAEPASDRLLRAALATPLLDLPLEALDRLGSDEIHWEERVEQFRGYGELWRGQGILAMLRRLMHDFHLPRRLSGSADGERRLTNLLHLSELLQSAAAALDGEHALIRFLAQHRAEQGTGQAPASEEQILRLESDGDRVQVITMHKSKGLQYPLVFLPFAAAYREVALDGRPLVRSREDGRREVHFEPDASLREAVDDDRLAEDLRLLYVALTRACHACWVGAAPVTRGGGKVSRVHRGALGCLLGGGEPIPDGRLEAALRALEVPGDGVIQVAQPPGEAVIPGPAGDGPVPPPRGGARIPVRPAREHWWIASYSALRLGGADAARVPETVWDEVAGETGADAEEGARDPGTATGESGGPLAGFPRGPEPGTFLHGLLEWAAVQGFARVASDPAALRDALARRCRRRGWEPWIDPLVQWLQRLLQTPLPLGASAGLRLAGLETYQAEMEFWFEASQVDTRTLDARVTAATLDGAPRPPLQADRLNGMLKGFMDLVFLHEGRYYVADYKSNWLGPGAADYGAGALRAAVLHRRYEMQAVLYVLALHRLLRARLPDYDYDHHLGGAAVVFLRGLEADTCGVHFERPPADLVRGLDRLFGGEGEVES